MTSDEISIRDPNTNEKFVFSFADICATDEMIAITYRMLCRYLATKSLSYAFTTVELFRDLIRSAFDETDKLVSCIDLAAIESWRVARETLINGVREWNREPSCSRFPHRGKEVPIEHVFRRFRV
ncbi:hypothetical protein, partial [Ralstonia pseudosolanacearum]|uniref:hypothetical protein n=1 Tax=Ralstonia pseudosolanacearum TaxID=1310165 RepID=UPI001E5ED2BB